MRRARPLIALLVTCGLLAGCSGRSTAVLAATPTPAVASGSTPSSAAPTATATPTPSIAATPTGPPPKVGTLAWYLYELPHFDRAPEPATGVAIAATGPARQFNQIPVGSQKVAFVTIDDGWLKDPDIVTMLRAAQIPFTMFLTSDAIKSDPAYFKTLESLGGVIEDHTVTHPKLSHQTYDQQRREICDNRATLTRLYGRAPIIMRSPYGLANADTLKAAASCGIRANVFWTEYAITGSITWQRPGGIHPGDMVLMHFDKYLKANLLATLQAFHHDGITPALLEDYLVVAPPAA